MYLKHLLVTKQAIKQLSRFNGRFNVSSSPNLIQCRNLSGCIPSTSLLRPNVKKFVNPKPVTRYIHSTRVTDQEQASVETGSVVMEEEGEEDASMTEFLSRFVWIMRGKLSEVYSDLDKETINKMLLVIVTKVVEQMEKGGFKQMVGSAEENGDFSPDLWNTVWEVSNTVVQDMEKEQKKEKMKGFLQNPQVQEMCRFAGEVGIRGDLLRELRFKWAREKMEETEFYEGLEKVREEEKTDVEHEGALVKEEEEETNVASLPLRKGKIKYKIYGLDLSDPKWAEMADKVHEAGEVIWPQEPKPVTGKCKLVMEKIVSLQVKDDPSPLIGEWLELLKPTKVDWMALLDRLQKENSTLYFKVAELALDEKSFQTNVRDYSKLVDAHAKENRVEDVERILKKMKENGITPDIVTATVLVHMYSKAGNLVRAKESFETLKNHGFQPDSKVYNSMIMAYLNAGILEGGELLMRDMDARDIKPSREIYMSLLRAFALQGDGSGAERIETNMQFADIQPTLESCSLLVQAYGLAGDPDQARRKFDNMIKLGHKPDDKCIASMISAYQKKNLLDKALHLLVKLEKDNFEIGVATYTVLLDWMGQLQLIDEAEQILAKMSDKGKAPPLKVQVSLCDMYSRARNEKKTLQALSVLEAKKDQLEARDFERIAEGLVNGGFFESARKIRELMESRGFEAPGKLEFSLMASQSFKSTNVLGGKRSLI